MKHVILVALVLLVACAGKEPDASSRPLSGAWTCFPGSYDTYPYVDCTGAGCVHLDIGPVAADGTFTASWSGYQTYGGLEGGYGQGQIWIRRTDAPGYAWIYGSYAPGADRFTLQGSFSGSSSSATECGPR